MANKQPFYHKMDVLFTATDDLSEEASTRKFLKKLAKFLREELGTAVIANSVALDGGICEVDPGDPHDLM
jgi:hypothetical protein